MRDMKFISGDGESLILETADGERMRVAVDRSLRDALANQPTASGDHSITPREIQDAIRSGASVDSLVSSSGEAIDYILKFATPVLEELEHVTRMALAVRVEVGPDRFNEVRLREFGELMLERLRNGGASAIEWSTTRTTTTTWTITAKFETMGGYGAAIWLFDPRASVLSPENETAIGLSNQSGFGDSPIPKLKSIVPAEEPEAKPAAEEAPITELLDAFKARREAVEQSEALTEPEIEVETAGEPEPVTEAKPKGRAPMPSWDQIIFGAKSEEQPTED